MCTVTPTLSPPPLERCMLLQRRQVDRCVGRHVERRIESDAAPRSPRVSGDCSAACRSRRAARSRTSTPDRATAYRRPVSCNPAVSVTRTRVPMGSARSATKPTMRGVNTVKCPAKLRCDRKMVRTRRRSVRLLSASQRHDRRVEDHPDLRQTLRVLCRRDRRDPGRQRRARQRRHRREFRGAGLARTRRGPRWQSPAATNRAHARMLSSVGKR